MFSPVEESFVKTREASLTFDGLGSGRRSAGRPGTSRFGIRVGTARQISMAFESEENKIRCY